MRKPVLILYLILAATTAFFDQRACAVLTKSGDVIFDSVTGLEWLVMGKTVNKSPDQIMDGDYGLKASGWVHATIQQVSTLFLDAGITKPFSGGSTPWNYEAAKQLMDLLGNTYEVNNEWGQTLGVQAFSGSPGLAQGELYVPYLLVGIHSSGNTGGADVPGLSVPSGVVSPSFGNWLVRPKEPIIFPPTFDNNSAVLTNVYVPMEVGDKLTYRSYGLDIIVFFYIEAISQETIDQVNCLKIRNSNSYFPNLISYSWFAQDTSGNVWIIKYYDEGANDLMFFGRNNAKLVMPSNVYVGSILWSFDATETVAATGVTVPKLSTGLGPYTNCIKSRINYGGGDIDFNYYAPGIGLVKQEFNDDGINGLEIFLIKRVTVKNSKSMPWLPLLLE